MQDEFLTRCVVDPVKRKFYLYSNEGQERIVECDDPEQFIAVLRVTKAMLPEGDDRLAYASL